MPQDDPPPYPGHEQIEKVPLQPSTSHVHTDTSGEDSPLHLPRYSQVIMIQQSERAALTSQEQPPSASHSSAAVPRLDQTPSAMLQSQRAHKFAVPRIGEPLSLPALAVPRPGESPIPALQQHQAVLASEQPPRPSSTPSTSCSARGGNAHACMCCHRSHVNTVQRHPLHSTRPACSGNSSH